ncbi:MAG: RNA methyltransferase [Acidobacteria bacterium]|nr:RNA methyltransferase [Acidobacteriota bacterium]
MLGLEGEHLITEALRSGLKLHTVFIREASHAALERVSVGAAEVLILTHDVFASAVETASPQGIAAMVEICPPDPKEPSEDPVLIVENLQDPGNLGTLIRSAEAFGAQRIYATERTVNAWNPKVVRASAGSVFRVPVLRMPISQIAAEAKTMNVVLYAAVAQAQGVESVLEIVFAPKCGLMIGNEGAGLSAEALALAQHRVRIPCAVESLNASVAGSMLLYEVMRQRTAHKDDLQ